jgi:hypothetical protein
LGKCGEMTQTLSAHMNKIKIKKNETLTKKKNQNSNNKKMNLCHMGLS